MSVNPQINTQVQSGQVPVTPSGQAVETKEATPSDIANQTDMQESDSLPIVIQFELSSPNLTITIPGSSLYSEAKSSMSSQDLAEQSAVLKSAVSQLALSFAVQMGQISQNMLDSWSKSIEETTQANKEASIKSDQTADLVKNDQIESTNKKDDLQKAQLESDTIKRNDLRAKDANPVAFQNVISSKNLVSYINHASSTERLIVLGDFGQSLVEQINNNPDNLNILLQDSMKVVPYIDTTLMTPLLTELTTKVLTINLALTMTNPETTSQQLQAAGKTSLDATLQINQLLPFVYNEAAHAALGVKKNQEDGKPKSKKQIDRDFVKEFANRVNKRAGQLMSLVNNPQVASALMISFAVLFQLDLKVAAPAGNLSSAEFKSMLNQGYPENQLLNTSVEYMNAILASQPENSRDNILNMVSNYIDGTPKYLKMYPDTVVDRLKELSYAPFLGDTEIGTKDRISSQTT
jgi:hypothetical protein